MFPNKGHLPGRFKGLQLRAKGQDFVLESPLDTAGSGYFTRNQGELKRSTAHAFGSDDSITRRTPGSSDR
jgi:hypothetical protein